MPDYRHGTAAIRALVCDDAVRQDHCISPELFDLEMERLWRSAWTYIGHDSQVPNGGDFCTVNIAGQPLLMLRGADGAVRVLLNRCAHKGAKILSANSGNCGKLLRCSYHGWTYTLDGSLRTVPVKSGYADTRFSESEAASRFTPVGDVAVYRGFVFARLNPSGASFEEYFGDSLSSIDNLADRSPVGRLEVAGAPLRYMHNSNWKMFVENLNDTMHPMVAHESSAGTARELWKDRPPGTPVPMVIEQFLPFVSNYEFFDKMGVQNLRERPQLHRRQFLDSLELLGDSGICRADGGGLWGRAGAGHSRGVPAQHGLLSQLDDQRRHSNHSSGAADCSRSNVDRELLHPSRLVGAPPARCWNAARCATRVINAPTSVVGHDDLYCYRAIQEGLASNGNEWVNLQRNYSDREKEGDWLGTHNGTSEVSMRGQFRAWVAAMTAGGAGP